MWIGLLYYFNFVNVAAAKAAAADGTAAASASTYAPRAVLVPLGGGRDLVAGAALLGRHFLEAFSS